MSCATCHLSGVTCHVSHITCHMSCAMCHVSCITCRMSHVTCHMSRFFCEKKVELVSGGSVINGAYPVYFFPPNPMNKVMINAEISYNQDMRVSLMSACA